VGWAMKPSAMILMMHSPVKMTVKMISISSRKSLVALLSPFGKGVKTANDMQVPKIVNRIKISNHFASVILINNCLMGFFNEKQYIERFALSGGGLTPGLLVGFLLIWSCFSGGGPDAGAAGS